jgi:hypothetical protein
VTSFASVMPSYSNSAIATAGASLSLTQRTKERLKQVITP